MTALSPGEERRRLGPADSPPVGSAPDEPAEDLDREWAEVGATLEQVDAAIEALTRRIDEPAARGGREAVDPGDPDVHRAAARSARERSVELRRRLEQLRAQFADLQRRTRADRAVADELVAGRTARRVRPGPVESMVRDLASADDVRSVLEAAVRVVHRAHPARPSVGILLRAIVGLEPGPATDAIAERGLAAEIRTGEGPASDAIRTREPVVGDLAQEAATRRWPRFTAAATGKPDLRSVAALPLYGKGNRPAGAVVLHTAVPIGDDGLETARTYAALVSLALLRAAGEEALGRALESRDVIGQAKGLLMQEHGIGSAEAFALLRRLSQESNVKLADIAGSVVARRSRGRPGV